MSFHTHSPNQNFKLSHSPNQTRNVNKPIPALGNKSSDPEGPRQYGMKDSWNWYTAQVKYCKSPEHNLHYLHHMRSRWCNDQHLRQTLYNSFVKPKYLDWIGLQIDEVSEASTKLASCVNNKVWHLNGAARLEPIPAHKATRIL